LELGEGRILLAEAQPCLTHIAFLRLQSTSKHKQMSVNVELNVELGSPARNWHLEEIVLDAHNRRRVWVGRGLWRWSRLTSYSKQGLNFDYPGSYQAES